MNYKVNDTESGNWVLYEGNSLDEAKETVLESMREDEAAGDTIVSLDIERDGDTIWSYAVNTIDELKRL